VEVRPIRLIPDMAAHGRGTDREATLSENRLLTSGRHAWPGLDRSRRRGIRLMAAVGALLFSACQSRPVELYSHALPPVVLATLDDTGVRDLRASYRAAVCRRLPATGPACDDVLQRLPGEGPPATHPATEGLPGRYRIVFVPGFFSECFDRFARPFSDARRALEAEGFVVDYVRVSGRATTTANARQLAEHFATLAGDPRPVIVVAHSKGLLDALELGVRHPEAAARIAAIVSVAGAMNGSPLADQFQGIYRDWLATFPLSDCAPGSGEEISDLRRDVRLEWWQRNRGAVVVPIFALVAAPTSDRISRAARLTYGQLARYDPRNDGQLIWYDQLIPGGFLLGYVNADHWTIAIPVSEEIPAASFMFRDDVPRAVLVRAALEVVAATLSASEGH
jgi:pimeloyl-ACP methyl ester carboxylesterase